MSLTDGDWNSCHDITSGCHKSGVFSYMVDNCTIIAYANRKKFKWEDEVELPLKRWRQCVYIDLQNKSAVFSRQYPNDNEVAGKKVRSMVNNLLANYFSITPKWKITRDINKIKSYVDDYSSDTLHYNDILSYSKIKATSTILNGGNIPNVVLGNDPYCPVCGDDYITNSEYLTCNSCSNIAICADCGEIIEGSSIYHNDNSYCASCFNNNFMTCEDCGEIVDREDSYFVHDRYGYIQYVCNDCLDDYDLCAHCEDRYYHTNEIDGDHYCESCTNRLFTECVDCEEYVKDDDIYYHNNDSLCESCYNDRMEEEPEDTEEIA